MDESLYNGFKRIDWEFNGRKATLIFPDKPAEGNRWLWRAEYLGAFDNVDVEMLKRGWFLAYCQVEDAFGEPRQMKLFDEFYRHVTKEYGLNKKTVMLGFSRGGLYSVSWAGTYPERTAGLYLDAAVMDIFYWPCRPENRGKEIYDKCAERYGLTEGMTKHPDNPFEKLPVIIKNKIPLVIVAGLADESVPFEINTKLLAEAYDAAGLKYFIKLKPGCGHHPHGMENPKEIADYIEGNMK